MNISRWYQSKAEAILEQLKVDQKQGLETSEAVKRLAEYGRNELKAAKPINPFKLFFSQFSDVLIIVLIIAATVSFGLAFVDKESSFKESVLIFVIVIAIAVVGFFNE